MEKISNAQVAISKILKRVLVGLLKIYLFLDFYSVLLWLDGCIGFCSLQPPPPHHKNNFGMFLDHVNAKSFENARNSDFSFLDL